MNHSIFCITRQRTQVGRWLVAIRGGWTLVMAVGGDGDSRVVTAGGLLADLPHRLEAERFDQLLRIANVRIERIVSTRQATPPGQWFDQVWDEWGPAGG
jgi:hypothetical protein